MSSPAAPAKTRTKTAYHVFEEVTEDGGSKAYRPVASNVLANNAEQAVRDHAEKTEKNQVLVAVPAARFKPVKVTVSSKAVVKLG